MPVASLPPGYRASSADPEVVGLISGRCLRQVASPLVRPALRRRRRGARGGRLDRGHPGANGSGKSSSGERGQPAAAGRRRVTLADANSPPAGPCHRRRAGAGARGARHPWRADGAGEPVAGRSAPGAGRRAHNRSACWPSHASLSGWNRWPAHRERASSNAAIGWPDVGARALLFDEPARPGAAALRRAVLHSGGFR
jgi:hypothetical protein